ncbi:unnamed protein product [Ranitomeya imitator]|uniref:Nuclear fragile X mental retardation-interacting protein 2-like n=1 Tax=Ranitomeya imitator TaxID=111125 RepID=A0ABN9KQ03_9NEOB|nr:unnamed protein product [Ranitomeya imitator]
MHKEHLAQDENSNPREGPVSRRKERLSPSEHDMNQLNRGRPKTVKGSWDSNGFGPEIEALAGRTEESVPLSPSNSLNLRHLRGCEKDPPSGRGLQRPPPPPPSTIPTTTPHTTITTTALRTLDTVKATGTMRANTGMENVKRGCPGPEGGPHTQRPRNREALNSTEPPCADMRPEQTAGDKTKSVSRQPSPPADKEPAADSWLLFKPLPVFPVDSSSARTLPKISYASKVKENLDGKGLVPSSALRTSTTLPNCLLNAAQSDAAALHTGSLSSSSCSSLSSSPPSPVSQENLGAIFQNEWGLSFINEPGAGQAVPPEVREPEEETPGGVEGGGDLDQAPPVMALVRLSHGFYIEGADPEVTTMENPKDWEAMVSYSLQGDGGRRVESYLELTQER